MDGAAYASGKPELVEEEADGLKATNPAALMNGIIGYLDPLSGGGPPSESTADAMRVMVLARRPAGRSTGDTGKRVAECAVFLRLCVWDAVLVFT
jgi:hypothetical protein